MSLAKIKELISKNYTGDKEEINKLISDLETFIDSLSEDSLTLTALENAGVDSWEGYDEAMKMLEEMREE